MEKWAPKVRATRPAGLSRGTRGNPKVAILVGCAVVLILGMTGLVLLPGEAPPPTPSRGGLIEGSSVFEAATDPDGAGAVEAVDQPARSVAANPKGKGRPDPKRPIRVQVVDDATGEPIPFAEVACLPSHLTGARYHTVVGLVDPVSTAFREGKRHTTDAQGIHEFTWPVSERLTLATKDGDLAGSIKITSRGRPPAGGVHVLRRSTHAVHRLQLADALGQPIPETNVMVMALGPRRKGTTATPEPLPNRSLGYTDEQGRLATVTITNLPSGPKNARPVGISVSVFGTGTAAELREVMVPLEPFPLAPQPLHLTIPDVGRIEVDVRHPDGAPAEDGTVMGLVCPGVMTERRGRHRFPSHVPGQRRGDYPWPAPHSSSRSLASRSTRGGIATFGCVALDKVFELPDGTRFAGPRTPGEVVRVTWTEPRPPRQITAAVTMPDGSPARQGSIIYLHAITRGSRGVVGSPVTWSLHHQRMEGRVGRDGHLLIEPGDWPEGHEPVFMVLQAKGYGAFAADITHLLPIPDGSLDLGAVTLGKIPTLVAGRIERQDALGRPLADQSLKQRPSANWFARSVQWRPDGETAPITLKMRVDAKQDGRFRLLGLWPQSGDYSIQLDAPSRSELQSAPRQDFQHGDTDVRVGLRTMCALPVELRSPAFKDYSQHGGWLPLRVVITEPGGSPFGDDAQSQSVGGVDGNGTARFELTGLEVGTVDLHVTGPGDTRVASRPGIRVRVGRNDLVSLDLGNDLQAYAVERIVPSGMQVSGSVRDCVRVDGEVVKLRTNVTPSSGVLPAELLDGRRTLVAFSIPGGPTAHIVGLRPGLQRVQVPKGGLGQVSAVKLLVEAVTELPDGIRADLQVQSSFSLEALTWQPGMVTPPLGWHGSPDQLVAAVPLDSEGATEFELRECQTHWALVLKGPPPLDAPNAATEQTIEGGVIQWPAWPPQGPVELQVDPERLRAALQAMGRGVR